MPFLSSSHGFARFRTAGTYVLIGTSLLLSGLPLCQLPCSCGAGVFVLCNLRQLVRSPASSHGANCGSDRQVARSLRSLLLSPRKRWLVKRLLLDPGDVCRDYRCAGALSAPWSRRAPTTTLSPASSTRGREHGGARLFALCAAVDGEIVRARTTRAARSSVPPLARPAAGADRPRGWRRGARRALPPRHLAPTAGALHRAAVAAPRSRHAARSRARSRAPLARVRVDSAQCSGSMPSCSGSSRA